CAAVVISRWVRINRRCDALRLHFHGLVLGWFCRVCRRGNPRFYGCSKNVLVVAAAVGTRYSRGSEQAVGEERHRLLHSRKARRETASAQQARGQIDAAAARDN